MARWNTNKYTFWKCTDWARPALAVPAGSVYSCLAHANSLPIGKDEWRCTDQTLHCQNGRTYLVFTQIRGFHSNKDILPFHIRRLTGHWSAGLFFLESSGNSNICQRKAEHIQIKEGIQAHSADEGRALRSPLCHQAAFIHLVNAVRNPSLALSSSISFNPSVYQSLLPQNKSPRN